MSPRDAFNALAGAVGRQRGRFDERQRLHSILPRRRDRMVLKRLLELPAGAPGSRVLVQVKPLRRRVVQLRPGTSDAQVLLDTFDGQYHRPPPPLHSETVATILDLGSNIGLTVADMAERFPSAHVVGFEADEATARVAQTNVEPWTPRVEVRRAAVWVADGEVTFTVTPGDEFGGHVQDPEPIEELAGEASVPAVSLDSVVGELGWERIDYVKMDVEGAERRLLREATAWVSRVRCIKVEVHAPYTVAECEQDLRALGFTPQVDTAHWSCVVGLRGR